MVVNLSRRSFLQGLATVAVAASIPSILPEKAASAIRRAAFDPTKEYGFSIPYTTHQANWHPESMGRLVEILKRHASARMPAGIRYEIRHKIPTDFGRAKAICWYRHPSMDAGELWSGEMT